MTTVSIRGNWLRRTFIYFHQGVGDCFVLDEVELRALFAAFCRFADSTGTRVKHARDSHGRLLPIHQLAIALRFYASGFMHMHFDFRLAVM